MSPWRTPTVHRSFRANPIKGHEKSFQSSIPTQNLLALFDAEGVQLRPLRPKQERWQLRVSLKSYGFTGATSAISPVAPVPQANRLEYRHGDLVEWYVISDHALEHGFTLSRPPAGVNGQPLLFKIDFSGSLRPRLNDKGDEIRLENYYGEGIIRYGTVLAWDARKTELPVRIVEAEGGLAIQVDAHGATYPITVDPDITEERR
jgi:hypothetical protein